LTTTYTVVYPWQGTAHWWLLFDRHKPMPVNSQFHVTLVSEE